MKAAVIFAPGPPQALQYIDVPDPVCGPGELLMRVDVISIEGGDTLNRTRPLPRGAPHIVGYQASGEVVCFGEGVTGFAAGDRISAFAFDGSHAELRAVKAEHAFRVPDKMDLVDAAVVPIAFGTAHDALFGAARLQPGETVLVQGAAGGVGMAAVQIAARVGARVIAAASSAAKLAPMPELGAWATIDTRTQQVAQTARELTGGKGVDVVMDGVGGAMLQQSILGLAHGGRIALVGAAGREGMMVDVSTLQRGAQSLTGVFLGPKLGTPMAHAVIEGYLRDVAAGRYRTLISRRFALSDAAAAHAFVESRNAVGRVVLVTDSYRHLHPCFMASSR